MESNTQDNVVENKKENNTSKPEESNRIGSFVFINKGDTTPQDIQDVFNKGSVRSYISENGRVSVLSFNAIEARELLEKTDLKFTYGS